MMNVKLALVLMLSSLAVIFVVQNAAAVEIGFLFWRGSISGSLLIFGVLMPGFVLGWFLNDDLRHRKYKGRAVYLRSQL